MFSEYTLQVDKWILISDLVKNNNLLLLKENEFYTLTEASGRLIVHTDDLGKVIERLEVYDELTPKHAG